MNIDLALVRPVTASDYDGVLPLLELRHSEFGLGRFNAESAAAVLMAAIHRTAPIFAGVICGDNGPEATIGLAIAKFWDEADEHMQALWDFVAPPFRKTDHARKLQRFAEMAAERYGCHLIMGGPIRAGSEGKVHAYCKHLKPAGAFFLYEGPHMQRATKKQRESTATALIHAFATVPR